MRKLSTTKLYIKQCKLKVLLTIFWQVIALCLAVWIAIKHFRELRQHSAGGIIRDCFVVYLESACGSAPDHSSTLRDLRVSKKGVFHGLRKHCMHGRQTHTIQTVTISGTQNSNISNKVTEAI
ncbi:hypothetical protein BDR06DRAFT_964385 [Suillus hirtellus]|nr:hypothetical protein BDR06DRAFT_964385 [Suillus hirtellus]